VCVCVSVFPGCGFLSLVWLTIYSYVLTTLFQMQRLWSVEWENDSEC